MSTPLAPFKGHPLEAVEGFVVVAYAGPDGTGDSGIAEDYARTLQLHESNRAVEFVRTGNNEENNRHRLIAALQKGGVLNKMIIIGRGDGSVHYGIRALLHPEMPAAHRDSILTSWALGHANDFYYATQDGAMAGYPLGTLEHPDAFVFDGFPLEVAREDNEPDYAFYWTAGPSAIAAANLATATHRERRENLPHWLHMPLDLAVVGATMLLPDRHLISFNDGEPELVTELQVTKLDRMGIESRFPSRLSEHEMYVSRTNSNSPVALGAAALRLKLGRTKGAKQAEPLSITSRDKKPIPIQSDGETGTLAPDETIIIKPSQRRVRIWATKNDV